MAWHDILWDNKKTLMEKIIALLFYPVGVVILWLVSITSFRSVLNTIVENLSKEALLAISTLLFLLLIIFVLYSLQTSRKVKNVKIEPDKNTIRENIELKKEITGLQETLKKYTDKETIRSKYTFDEMTGTLKEQKTNRYFCNKCLLEKGIETQLKSWGGGWKCHICDGFFERFQ